MSSPSSLRPAWHRGASGGGRGFQPPPQVSNERRSSGGNADVKQSNFNKFAALDDDDDLSLLEKKTEEATLTANSRSEALRSTNRSTATNSKGRSLADLARTSERERSASYGSAGDRSASGSMQGGGSIKPANPVTAAAPNHSTDAHVIRFTREKLLSMRPPSMMSPPVALREVLEGTVILSEVAQDPVCYDVFDPDAIWAAVARERKAARTEPEVVGRRSNRKDNSRWQRGVALPTAEEAKNRDAENPSDLWDDPVATGAASDFSAFGAMPEDDLFDFEKMAEATRKFEEEVHAEGARASLDADEGPPSSVKIDPKRPLASVGTTIQTGTSEEVNVFDDFDDPAAESAILKSDNIPTIKPGTEDKSATSKLMELIGVTRQGAASADVASVPLAVPASVNAWNKPKEDSATLSLNPWGTLLPGQPDNKASDFDLQARLRVAELERQKASEIERFRREQEHQRLLEQRQAEEGARELALRQQQDSVQSQVELVLLERISTILENSWGQSDLVTVLTALHSEDSRVIPLLSTTDALRALVIRNPRRVTLRPNPVFGTETLVLLMTNAQWQQDQLAKQQHSEAISRSQQEELKRREELLQLQKTNGANTPGIIPGAPWYYSDPQNNIQGPFRGEEMRQWLEAGYFKSDLPISQNQTGPFKPLSLWFQDVSAAFVYETNGGREGGMNQALDAEKAAAVREEKQRRGRESTERDRLAQEAVERQNREEMERQARDNGPNESSNQLKMMLGLGGSANVGGSSAPGKVEIKPSKDEPEAGKPLATETPVSSPTKSTAPAWGQTAKPVMKKSMSEIQEEEARAAAVAASRRENGRPSGSGWANVAASRGGSSAWSGGAAAQRPAVVIQRNATAPIAPTHVAKPQAAVTAANAQMSTAKPQTNTTTAEDFGAQMSPALEKWCKEQMQKLNGTDDLTLVAFCMTLQDPVEIRQYLTTYLGSTPQVNNFATDFINRKSGKMTQEEWETTGTKSKARKKKR